MAAQGPANPITVIQSDLDCYTSEPGTILIIFHNQSDISRPARPPFWPEIS